MAEAAGLALGVLGLFSTCVEAFDIIVSAKDCSKDYEELSALLGLQRLRFEIWGESVGLPSGRFNNEHKIPYKTELDLPQVRPDIERALDNIRQLLNSVTTIDGRYGATSATSSKDVTTTLRGTQIFQKSFDRLKKRIRKGQQEKSVLKVTRWALHDSTQFKETITRLTSFVDGLYQVTTSLGLLQAHYEALRIHEEINTITKEKDLELLAEATSKHSSSSIHQTVSDAASRRLSIVAKSVHDFDIDIENRSRPHSNASTYSFHTAKTRHGLEAVAEEASDDSEATDSSPKLSAMKPESSLTSMFSARSCAECEDASLECSTSEGSISCINCIDSQKDCSYNLSGSFSLSPEASTLDNAFISTLRSTPQHERLLAEAAARSRATPRALSFKAGDDHHGERTTAINDSNLDYWIGHGASLVYQAHRSNSVAKRMFHELKIIRKAKVPFISATPVADDLGRILASIEGPPETPYEGGIFWILVSASQKVPPGAPIIRFHTKIYHPNIDHRTGTLCADYEQKWSPAKAPASLRGHFAESTALWSERTSPDMWSLLSLLIAICGLLASPNANDPLVPEIAQKYVEDPDGYFEAAKMWTEKYANASQKPDEDSLHFPDELSSISEPAEPELHVPKTEVERIPSKIQDYLRATYDERFVDDWVPISTSTRHTSIFTKESDSSTAELPNEKEDPHCYIERTIDRLLNQDATEIHLRQTTGECLSKIEQWRMVREVRLALETCAYQNPLLTTSTKATLTSSSVRKLIGESALRQPCSTELEKQYFGLLRRSFDTIKVPVPSQEKISDSTLPIATSPKPTTKVAPIISNHDPVRISPKESLSAISETSTKKSVSSSINDEPSSEVPAHPETKSPVNFYSIYSQYNPRKSETITPKTFIPRYTSNGYYASAAKPIRKTGSGSTASTPTYIYPEYYSASTGSSKVRSASSDPKGHVRRGQTAYYGLPYRTPSDSEEDEYIYYEPHGQYQSQARSKRSSYSFPQRPNKGALKSSPSTPKATEEDAHKHRIPPGYSLKNWDPSEEPIMLLGSVFDSNSLGKWIYDWTVYHHGPATPISDMAGELWLLLIQLAGKIKRAEECMPRIRWEEDRELVEDFIESGERLTDKLKKLLKSCEAPMLKAATRKEDKAHLGKNAGTKFIDTIFGRDQKLEATEKFMSSIRLWNLRFDANCEDILRNPTTGNDPVMDPVGIRTAFGLEDIVEESRHTS